MCSEPFNISSEPSEDAADVVRRGVYEHNFDATGRAEYHDVALFARDGNGSIRGGLLGYVWADWLHITDLWVAHECRGRGLGKQLLARAEGEAASLGAHGAFLSTFDFQAPDFYRAFGYQVRAVFEDYPFGHRDLHMWKVFGQGDRGAG